MTILKAISSILFPADTVSKKFCKNYFDEINNFKQTYNNNDDTYILYVMGNIDDILDKIKNKIISFSLSPDFKSPKGINYKYNLYTFILDELAEEIIFPTQSACLYNVYRFKFFICLSYECVNLKYCTKEQVDKDIQWLKEKGIFY